MNINKLQRDCKVVFENCDRVDFATVKVVTPKAILFEWSIGTTKGEATSSKWIPKSSIARVEQDRTSRVYRLTVDKWIWETS